MSDQIWGIHKSDQRTALIRRLFVDSIARELEGGGFRTQQILAEHGLSERSWQHPYAFEPLDAYIRLFEDTAKLLQRPFLGCEMGQAFRFWDIGPVYPLLAMASSLRNALQAFAHFHSSWQTSSTTFIHEAYNETEYSYFIDDLRIWPRRQDAEFAMASICSLVRQLISENWTPIEVRFEHDISERAEVLKKFFRCPVRGNAASNSIILRDKDLDRPVRPRLPDDTAAWSIVERHLQDLLRIPEDAIMSLEDRIAAAISQRLGREKTDLEVVAGDIGLSARSIRRQLQALGTSFGEILQQERLLKAENLMSGGEIKMDQLARRLGFKNPAAFSRAYRQWTGRAPSDDLKKYRREIKNARR